MKARILKGETKPEPEKLRRIEHERWRRFHILNNWRYGVVRDELKRLHPDLAAFDALPENEQAAFDLAWKLYYHISSKKNR